jgi:hypothetical protein
LICDRTAAAIPPSRANSCSGADAVMPDPLISPTFEAFRDGRDEPLEWILKATQRERVFAES